MAASFVVEHVVCQNTTDEWHLLVPLSFLADVRACVEASGAPFPSRGFSPELKAPHMYLVHAGDW